MNAASWPVLSLLLATPAMGAVLVWLLPSPGATRWVALLSTLGTLALTSLALVLFDPDSADLQLMEQVAWIPSLGVQYLVGVDGLSVLFLPATAVLFVGVVVASWTSTRTLPRLYFSLLLLLEAATLGVFCALDTLLFFQFWELTLVPMYFLIGLWGIGPNRRYAAIKYTLVMLVSGVPLLFGFVVLALAAGANGPTFDYPTLLANPPGPEVQTVVFLLLLAGFAAKVPLFPLHTWLPTVAMEGPVAVTAVLTGLKLGIYGLLRFALPLAPEAAQDFRWLLATLGLVGLLYGALAALTQTNLRRMLAYASVSHVGLVLLGLASFTLQGLQGALFQLANFTLISGGLFLLLGALHHRIGSTDAASLGGAARTMPLLAAAFLLLGLASLGVPGTSGFAAEHLLILGVLQTDTGAGLTALAGLALGAAYFLGLYRQAFQGPVRSEAVASALDLRTRELWLVMGFIALTLLLGLYPQPVLELSRAASEAWLARLGGG